VVIGGDLRLLDMVEGGLCWLCWWLCWWLFVIVCSQRWLEVVGGGWR
jgi:hypothetical protein